jgi:glucan phosphoethanolaminetransferase (alkaline phosphatase superfamily)
VITRFASVGIIVRLQNKVISICYFCFFSVLLCFSMFALFTFLFFVSAASKQKESVIFHLVTGSNHIYIYIYIYIYRERERERERDHMKFEG